MPIFSDPPLEFPKSASEKIGLPPPHIIVLFVHIYNYFVLMNPCCSSNRLQFKNDKNTVVKRATFFIIFNNDSCFLVDIYV